MEAYFTPVHGRQGEEMMNQTDCFGRGPLSAASIGDTVWTDAGTPCVRLPDHDGQAVLSGGWRTAYPDGCFFFLSPPTAAQMASVRQCTLDAQYGQGSDEARQVLALSYPGRG